MSEINKDSDEGLRRIAIIFTKSTNIFVDTIQTSHVIFITITNNLQRQVNMDKLSILKAKPSYFVIICVTIIINLSTVSPALAYRNSYEEGSATYSGSWSLASKTGYSGGSQKYTNVVGSYATFTFTGTSIAWISGRGFESGSAKIYMDGVYRDTYNLQSDIIRDKQLIYVTSRTYGTHTIKIEAVGDGYIAIDRFDVDVDYQQVLVKSPKVKWDVQRVPWAFLRVPITDAVPVPSFRGKTL